MCKKKYISLILAFTLCLSALALPAAAYDADEAGASEELAAAVGTDKAADTTDMTEAAVGTETDEAAADDDTVFCPEGLAIQQSRHGTCTLCSAAMMLRMRLYLDNFLDWDSPTESVVSNYAWCSQGLLWSWSYPTVDGPLTVAHASVSGLAVGELEAILEEHPEGIALYCGNWPHAVYLFGYEDGVFWCADPAYGTVCPLTDSCLGSYGGQDSILANVTAYWYIEN